MNALTESANGEGNAIKENYIIDALWRCLMRIFIAALALISLIVIPSLSALASN